MSSFIPSLVSPFTSPYTSMISPLKDALTPATANITNASQTPPPVIEDTQAKVQDQADMLRRRKGRASAILTKSNAAAPTTASKQLLGQ